MTHNLEWATDSSSSAILFYCDGELVHTGALHQRHQARLVYWLVVQFGMSIQEAKDIWRDMVNRQGLPPYNPERPTLQLPPKVKYCECGHFLYEHSEPSDFKTRYGLGEYIRGCLKCSCKEFKQYVTTNANEVNANRKG